MKPNPPEITPLMSHFDLSKDSSTSQRKHATADIVAWNFRRFPPCPNEPDTGRLEACPQPLRGVSAAMAVVWGEAMVGVSKVVWGEAAGALVLCLCWRLSYYRQPGG
jgi:hypothetical protein